MKKLNIATIAGLMTITALCTALGSGAGTAGKCENPPFASVCALDRAGQALGNKGTSGPGDPCGHIDDSGPNDGKPCGGVVAGGEAKE